MQQAITGDVFELAFTALAGSHLDLPYYLNADAL
jgi:hypothetical protein